MEFESAGKIIHESHIYFKSRKFMKPVCDMQLNMVLGFSFLCAIL